MAQSKNKALQKLVDTPFIDFDSCHICNSHNGPFIWIRKSSHQQFICEECYEKEMKKKQNEIPLG